MIALILSSIIFSNVQASQKLIGQPAPIFKSQAVFPDGSVGNLNLEDYKGKNIVLYFYPMDNSPGCTIQAQSFRNEIARLQNKNIMVIGISSDSIQSHLKFQNKLALPYPLASDQYGKNAIAKKYYATGFFFNKRITFLINQDGIIFKIFDNVTIQDQINDILNSFAEQK